MNKRILIFSTAYLPLIGGAEVAVKEITDRLGFVFDFVMITARLDPELPTRETIGNVEVHRIGIGNQWDKYRLIFYGYKKARELGDFDLVWSVMASYAGFAALRFKKKKIRVPFLLTLQEGDSRWQIYKHVWWCWPYFKQIFLFSDRIQAISHYLSDWARDLGARCPIDIVPNGASLLSSGKVDVALSRKEIYHAKETDIILLTVSRLVRKNGVADLIEAVARLPQEYKLHIVGDGKLRSPLLVRARRLGVLDTRVFFHGLVPHELLPPYYKASNVFARVSHSEGMGNVFIEAMGSGVPVVATRVGGIIDFVKDGRTGWLCEPGNIREIVEKILFVTSSKNAYEVSRVSDAALRMVDHSYDWNKLAARMGRLFSFVI